MPISFSDSEMVPFGGRVDSGVCALTSGVICVTVVSFVTGCVCPSNSQDSQSPRARITRSRRTLGTEAFVFAENI